MLSEYCILVVSCIFLKLVSRLGGIRVINKALHYVHIFA